MTEEKRYLPDDCPFRFGDKIQAIGDNEGHWTKNQDFHVYYDTDEDDLFIMCSHGKHFLNTGDPEATQVPYFILSWRPRGKSR